MYLGGAGMKAQMKYADRRGAPCVVIQGSQEREQGEVQVKDLVEGAKRADAIASNAEWKARARPRFPCPKPRWSRRCARSWRVTPAGA
jgi:histidyl-tRNA synthetase